MADHKTDTLILSFNCSGLQTSQEQLTHFIKELYNDLQQNLTALLLQECFMSYDLMMQLKIPGYRPVAASKGIIKRGKPLNRRGCVILVEDSVNVQPLKERTHNKVEMIGVKIIGDNNKKYEVPYELWCVYSGPYVKRIEHASNC